MSELGEAKQEISSNKKDLLTRIPRIFGAAYKYLHRLGPSEVEKKLLSDDYTETIIPEEYEDYVLQESGFNREALGKMTADMMFEYLPPVREDGSHSNIVDIAAGTGIISRSLIKRGFEVTAVDKSMQFLDYLHQKSPSIPIAALDMNGNFPFKDNSFDGATIVMAGRFIKDTDHFLKEVSRILKPGGVFVWPMWMFEGPEPIFTITGGFKKPDFLSLSSLRQAAEKNGFSVAKVLKNQFYDNLKNILKLKAHHPNDIPFYMVAKK